MRTMKLMKFTPALKTLISPKLCAGDGGDSQSNRDNKPAQLLWEESKGFSLCQTLQESKEKPGNVRTGRHRQHDVSSSTAEVFLYS